MAVDGNLFAGLAGDPGQSSRMGQDFQEQGSPDFIFCNKMTASSPEPQLLWFLRGWAMLRGSVW